jgi:hypothetical protein
MKNPMSRWALAAVLTVLTFAACVVVAEAHDATRLLTADVTASWSAR